MRELSLCKLALNNRHFVETGCFGRLQQKPMQSLLWNSHKPLVRVSSPCMAAERPFQTGSPLGFRLEVRWTPKPSSRWSSSTARALAVGAALYGDLRGAAFRGGQDTRNHGDAGLLLRNLIKATITMEISIYIYVYMLSRSRPSNGSIRQITYIIP